MQLSLKVKIKDATLETQLLNMIMLLTHIFVSRYFPTYIHFDNSIPTLPHAYDNSTGDIDKALPPSVDQQPMNITGGMGARCGKVWLTENPGGFSDDFKVYQKVPNKPRKKESYHRRNYPSPRYPKILVLCFSRCFCDYCSVCFCVVLFYLWALGLYACVSRWSGYNQYFVFSMV
ncbi:hypothetical protein EDD85DRAFT_796826 [Armillaria nabsnona]|nr:hypothetical protein EDD85DRAFT_796826 [Armillaria nabsnona]